ncbi:hypothetical protein M422DRAFT_38532 [Sphaerobolus stellatus SS14]|uniref:Acetyl-CoA carboxylase n=1 Tax=Sphaerobolus stellatus (strain SS14) TaxID=990650 RepID=A0A0C9U9F2_SPHS4|nr:hypothetical protein M422DRAFT_38532 [Sphaerobolus stellatus SS14]
MSTTGRYKVLVANRGEIAIRVIRSATELGWDTVAIYTENDESHATFADEAVKLGNTADFMNVDVVVQAAVKTGCTHLHPGYGFLSENPALPLALTKTSVVFVGPSPDTLKRAADKMLSRELADSLDVQIAPGKRINSADEVRSFASMQGIGFPVMIKALDGGGGRGIRVVHEESMVEEAFKRCLGESPSKQLFVEKALTGPGWKHIEIQIIGDGSGAVNHFWERECSVQRRFQKIIELRLTAEDPFRDFQLTAGNIKSHEVNFPAGRGIRVDTWLGFSTISNWNCVVGTEFDSLLAKLIIHAPTFEEANSKALRSLKELVFSSKVVKTNRRVLEGVLRHADWQNGSMDTLWLERNLPDILSLGSANERRVKGLELPTTKTDEAGNKALSRGNAVIQPGSLFHLSLTPASTDANTKETKHTITLTNIFHNAFPEQLSGTLLTSFSPQASYTFSLSQSTSASNNSGDFQLADPNDPLQISSPMTGKVVELHPALSGEKRGIKKGEPLIILSVMKMETVIAAPRDGWIARKGKGVKVGVVLGEGTLVCVFEEFKDVSSKL